ncbi:syntaxin-72 [Manihot esculenta]|uniref:Uncharacterized protein n=1 Tax=Manihot esculenta TaxID=3983 RepID=A0ACB7GW41_MANES|nr:syntaxin-72 [Manihot esculenta]KAG8644578.1 hypothetical protein MANES_11G142701v8 [Manihot esculenta]
MSVIDILFRVDEICKKFDKHDVNKQREFNAYGDDAFAHLYASVESDIEAALNNSIQRSINYKTELSSLLFYTQQQHSGGRKNEKTTILEDKLLALPNCGVQASLSDCTHGEYNKVKGLSKEELEICHDLVLALPERIQAKPDGTIVKDKQTGGWAGSAPNKNVKFDSSDEQLQDDFTNKVKNQVNLDEYEMWKLKQRIKVLILYWKNWRH